MRGPVAILVLCLAAGAAMAQPKAEPKAAPKATPKAQVKASIERPVWGELTADQQKVLAPLKADWDALDRGRKLKWVGIAKRYPAMKPAEQQRVQVRMQAWAKLTPQQRRQARETYKQLAKQPPATREKLRDKWAEYQRQTPGVAPLEQAAASDNPAAAKEPVAAEAEETPAPTIPASPSH